MATTARVGALVAAVVVFALLLGACGSAAGDDNGSYVTEFHQKLHDGRTVVCLSQMTQNGNGGLSCDWGHAR